MDQLKTRKAAVEDARKREELARWLTIYHDEFDHPQGGSPPP